MSAIYVQVAENYKNLNFQYYIYFSLQYNAVIYIRHKTYACILVFITRANIVKSIKVDKKIIKCITYFALKLGNVKFDKNGVLQMWCCKD